MKCNTLTTAVLILGIPSLTFAAAQTPGTAPPKQDTTARPATSDDVATYASVSKLIGANVWSRAEAGGDRDDLADIKDFIVDAETGKVDFVILSSGGVGSVGDSLRRISFSDLRFEHDADKDECKVMVELGEAEFDRIAKIEEDSLDPYRAKTVAASFRDRQAGTREGSGDKQDAGVRDAQMRASGAILASELDDFEVRVAPASFDNDGKAVETDKLGSIDEAWINTETGKVEYLTFDYKDRMLVFPVRALVTHAEADGKGLFFLAPAADRLAAAPAFDEAKKWDLKNAEFRQNVDRFYATKDGAVKKPADGVRREGDGSGK